MRTFMKIFLDVNMNNVNFFAKPQHYTFRIQTQYNIRIAIHSYANLENSQNLRDCLGISIIPFRFPAITLNVTQPNVSVVSNVNFSSIERVQRRFSSIFEHEHHQALEDIRT